MTSVSKPSEFIPGGYPSTPDQDKNNQSSPFDSQPKNDESILTKVTNMGSSAFGSVVGSSDKTSNDQTNTSSNQHDESILTKVTNMGSSALGSVVGSNPSGDTTAKDHHSPSSNQPNLSSTHTESQTNPNKNDESILTKVTNMGSSALGSVVGSNPSGDTTAKDQTSPSSKQPNLTESQSNTNRNDESILTKVTNKGSSALGSVVGSTPSGDRSTEDQHNQHGPNHNDESILTKVTNMGSSALGSVVGSNPSGDTAAKDQPNPKHNDESILTKVTNMGSSALGSVVGSNQSDDKAAKGQHRSPSDHTESQSNPNRNDENIITKAKNMGSSALGSVVGSSGDRSTEGQHSPSQNQPNLSSPRNVSQTSPNDESFLTKVSNIGSSALGSVIGSNPFGDKPHEANQAKISESGSSALGGVGTNPIGDTTPQEKSDSPSNPFSEKPQGEVDTSHTLKPGDLNESSNHGVALPNAILPETRTKSHKTFDLTGDYNKQKENEQRADSKVEHDYKREQDKEHESTDFGVKPLNKQPPLPYKPTTDEISPKGHATSHVPSKDHPTPHVPSKDHATPHVPSKDHPTPNVPPKDHASPHVPPINRSVDERHQADETNDDLEGHKITRKDKVNATIDKAVGTLKQKLGKLVKNDQMIAKGADKKSEADKIKEIAEIQKQANEF
ncbi:5065_t:CDS:10 [Funneliformis geosporum]|uniref:3581_t:CDS:1 n=1 Tax=Funneliformis geosporum TaxID=1117311 RepID=A0A9W4SAZ6_9GLOM|nr:5065_t:CDS:10 [Funneliformis geosporum]CAI2162725.1 3581_t:CDS:10 [Funneliformis geosporum]